MRRDSVMLVLNGPTVIRDRASWFHTSVRWKIALVQHAPQIISIAAGHRLSQYAQLLRIDVTHSVGSFIGRGDNHSLAFLDRLNKIGGLQKRFVCAGIQPCDATT